MSETSSSDDVTSRGRGDDDGNEQVESATTEVKQRLHISASHDIEQRRETAVHVQGTATTDDRQPLNQTEASAFDNQVQPFAAAGAAASAEDDDGMARGLPVGAYNDERYRYSDVTGGGAAYSLSLDSADASEAALNEMLPATFELAFGDNRDELIKKLDVSHGLLEQLLDREIINDRHFQVIKAETTESGRVEKLLDILLRRDDRLLPRLCDILKVAQQPHIVDIFRRNAAVPIHVAMNPPVGQEVEQYSIAELTRANGIVSRLKRTSPDVIHLMSQLGQPLSEHDRRTIENQLANEFEAALYQGGVPLGMVPELALMLAHNTVRDIQMVVVTRGDSLVVYFLCRTVEALFKLGQMITCGLMHVVFAVVIESQARTTVDVYVRADEFNLRLLCLTSPHDKVLRSPPSPSFFKSPVYQRDSSPPIKPDVKSLPSSMLIRREKTVVYQRISLPVAADAARTTSSEETLTVDYLFYELREPILLSACWLSLRTEMKVEMRPSVDIYVRLSSVCDRFYEVVRDKRFRRIIRGALKVTCSPYRHHVDLVRRLTYKERRDVAGVTTLNNKIFVVYQELQFIVVYMSQEPYTRLPNISINGLKSPTDIAAGSLCLYVSDPFSHAIWRVKAADSKVGEWLSEVKAFTVSVTSEEKLVLLVNVDYQGSFDERNRTWRGEIHVYSPGAVKETVIKLSRDITAPLHVVMTTRKTFIVNYGVEWHEMNRVCEVDMTGRVLKAFGSSPGEGVGQLHGPVHVSLDDEERIIVADLFNNRVLLLNRQLMLQRVLVKWPPQSSHDDADGPVRLHYDSHSGRLLVGLASGHVDIYKLRV